MNTKIIVKNLLEYKLSIPEYQRAYSWKEKQYQQFLQDILEHIEYVEDYEQTPYFIGHILLEKISDSSYHIIDGQQRVTTTVIVLAIVEKLLKEHNIEYTPLPLTHFSTVPSDKDKFQSFINTPPHTLISTGYETTSLRNCAEAFIYFQKQLTPHGTAQEQQIEKLQKIYNLLTHTECTVQFIDNKIDAVKRFIFENNRGKEVSKLELFKSLCMYQLYLKKAISNLEDFTRRFEKINSLLEKLSIHDDNFLLQNTSRIYYNSLRIKDDSPEKLIHKFKKTNNSDVVQEIDKFSLTLLETAEHLYQFIKESTTNQELSHTILCLLYLEPTTEMYPFIIKAYRYNLSNKEKLSLFQYLEKLLFHIKIISTKAELIPRLDRTDEYDVYKQWTQNGGYQAVIDRIHLLCYADNPVSWWWNYWTKSKYLEAIEDKSNLKSREVIRYILFKYEYALWQKTNQSYTPHSFNDVHNPEVEHIAPRTPKQNDTGYSEYDEDFKQNYLDTIGNYILLPKKENIQARNNSFQEKCKIYQQSPMYHIREIAQNGKFHPENGIWDKEAIRKRNEELLNFIRNELG